MNSFSAKCQLFLESYAMKPLLKSLSYIHVFLPFVPFWNISFLISPPKVESLAAGGRKVRRKQKARKRRRQEMEEGGGGGSIQKSRGGGGGRYLAPGFTVATFNFLTYKTGPKQQKIVPGFDSISKRSEIGESLSAFSTHTLRSPLQVCLAGSLPPPPPPL